MRRAARPCGIAAVACALLAMTLAGGAADAAPGQVTAVGWWSRSPASAAPDGGFAVATAPDGPVAVAAVRIDLGDAGVDAARLEAPEAGGVAAETATLVACPTDNSWRSGKGALADAPRADCAAASVPFTRDAGRWRADVTALVASRTGPASIMIVPGPAAAPGTLANTVVFEVRFGPPAAQVTPAAAATAPGDAPAPAPAPVPAREVVPAPPAYRAVDNPVFASFDPKPAPPPPATGLALDARPPAPVAAAPASSGPEVVGAGPVRPTGESGGGRRWGQALLFVVVATVAGTVGAVGRRWLTTGPLSRLRLAGAPPPPSPG